MKKLLVFKKETIVLFLAQLLLIVLLFDTRPFTPRLSWFDIEDVGPGNFFRQLVILLLMGFFLVSRFLNNKVFIPPFNYLLVFLFCAISCLWAQTPFVSLRTLIVSFISFYSIYIVVQTVGYKCFLQSFEFILFLIILFSVLSIPFAGELVFHSISDPEPSTIGSFRGLFYHKNSMGSVCALFILISCYLYFEDHNRTSLYKIGFGIAVLLLTNSLTPLILVALCITLYLVLNITKRFTSARYFSVLFSLFLITFFAFSFFVITKAADNVSSFSGRGEIWSVMLRIIEQEPLWGFGYSSLFGTGEETFFTSSVSSRSWMYNVASAHNGYLELLSSVGIVGTIIFFISFFFIPLFSLSKKRSNSNSEIFIYILFFYVLIHNLIESSFIIRNKPTWIILSLAIAILVEINGRHTFFRKFR